MLLKVEPHDPYPVEFLDLDVAGSCLILACRASNPAFLQRRTIMINFFVFFFSRLTILVDLLTNLEVGAVKPLLTDDFGPAPAWK